MSISSLHIEMDKVDRNSWDQLITQFDDASINQTWSYGASAGRSVSHIVIKSADEILGCCQVSLRRLPFCNIGIADISWGPLCMKRGGNFKPEIMIKLLHGIKEEYAIKRGYFLRISPHGVGERKELLTQFFESEGFERNTLERPYRTLKLDLSPSLDELRKNFLQKWRNCLNKAEKTELRVVEGTNNDLFKKSVILAKEMAKRKNLTTIVDYYEGYRRIQEGLPEPLKMKIMICEADNEPVCTAICSAIGDTGIYVLGATSEKGLKLNGSYLLQWRMIQWMKEKGIRYYDLGAFNPELNPSVYHFKLGVAGKKGWEETFLGEWHGCFNLFGRMTKLLFNGFKFLREKYRERKRL